MVTLSSSTLDHPRMVDVGFSGHLRFDDFLYCGRVLRIAYKLVAIDFPIHSYMLTDKLFSQLFTSFVKFVELVSHVFLRR